MSESKRDAPRPKEYAGALLYTVVGGYLDAYAYLAHGHVFANAQTGNVVLFAVHAVQRDWVQAGRHVPPIAAFGCGVFLVTLAKRRWIAMPDRLRLWSAALEAVVLGLLFVFQKVLPNAWVVPAIAFLAALQHTSFRTVEGWPFNSAMTTGNLRDAVIGLASWLTGDDVRQNRAKSLTLAAVCLSFLAGALLGGLCTLHLSRFALLPCMGIVILAATIAT